MPVISLVVQIDPGPIPTLTMSAPESAKNFAALPVAIFPAQTIQFFEILFILLIVFNTFLVWPMFSTFNGALFWIVFSVANLNFKKKLY